MSRLPGLTACTVHLESAVLAEWSLRPVSPTPLPAHSPLHQMLVSALQESGGLTAEFEGFLVTADPAVVGKLFNSKAHCAHRSIFYWASSWILPHMDGVLNMDGERWREHTRVLTPIFHGSHVRTLAPVIATAARRHVQAWLQGKTAEHGILPDQPQRTDGTTGGASLLEAVRGIGMEVVLVWAAGLDPLSTRARALAYQLALYPKLVGNFTTSLSGSLGNRSKLNACGNAIKDAAVSTAKAVMAAKAAGGRDAAIAQGDTTPGLEDLVDGPWATRNFLEVMSEANFTDAEMGAAANHVHGAHKAASFVIACALHSIAQTPAWRTAMREEWAQKLTGDDLTAEDVERLPVTRAVVQEALRRHVVSLGVVRKTGESIVLREKLIPAGCEIVVLLHALHHHPDLWTDPYKFAPDRWLTQEQAAAALRGEVLPDDVQLVKPAKHTFEPFLSGGRMCAGKVLALQELAIAIITILRVVDVHVPDGPIVLKPDMYSTIDGDIPFTVTAL